MHAGRKPWGKETRRLTLSGRFEAEAEDLRPGIFRVFPAQELERDGFKVADDPHRIGPEVFRQKPGVDPVINPETLQDGIIG